MKRLCAAALFLCLAGGLRAQTTTTILATTLVGGDGATRIKAGRVTFSPTDLNGNRLFSSIFGGGLMVPTSAVCLIADGAITTNSNGGTCTTVNTALSNPAIFCYVVVFQDTVTRWTSPPLKCVQPFGTLWSFDGYVPPAGPVGNLLQVGPVGITGPITPGHCTNWADSTHVSDAGAACGTGGGGGGSSPTATPTFTPGSPYSGGPASVTISDTTTGAAIFFCADTTNTCTPSQTYTGALGVTSSEYLRAVANGGSGFALSSVASWQGTISGTQTALPTFSPTSPYAGGGLSVTISDATSGAAISYCTDTTNTCTPGTAYTVPVVVSATGYIRATATAGGLTISSTASWQGTISTVLSPTFTPPSPYTGDSNRVSISDSVGGATISYCTDTTNTCTPGTAYTTQINVVTSEYIRATATLGGTSSPVASWQGTIAAGALNTYTDTLIQANGPLGANWSQVIGSGCNLTVVSDMGMSSGGGCGHGSMSSYTAGTFNNNQFSRIIYGNVTASPVGYDTLVVRSSGQSTYNDAYGGYSSSYALGVVNPTPSDFATPQGTVAPAAGNTVELDVAGIGPVFFWGQVNGVINIATLDTAYNYIGGFPGFGVVDFNTVPTATVGAWAGGSLPSFSAIPADNFTRANAGWLGVNWWFPWTSDEAGGGWIISGGEAVPALASSTSFWNISIWTSALGANPYSQITVGGLDNWLGPVIRYTPMATNGDSMYAAFMNGGSLKLYARKTGSWHLMTSWSYTPTVGDTVLIQATGTSPVNLTVTKNGTVLGTWSDTVYLITGQYAGFAALGSNATKVSNWVGGTQ